VTPRFGGLEEGTNGLVGLHHSKRKGGRVLLTKDEIKEALTRWNKAWDKHDLDGVMALFHEDILFENFTGGKARGKENLRKAWAPWFANHGGFRFIEEETFIDEDEQKVLYRWELHWPSFEKGYEGKPEVRRGVDVIHFRDGKIINKLTYSKTSLEIEGERISLSPVK
jgi:ketosteroid isomerase-like protein